MTIPSGVEHDVRVSGTVANTCAVMACHNSVACELDDRGHL